jgi:3-deoxy-D-manno-octulosonic-acid transferase
MLNKLNVVAAQSKTDAQRLINLGANPKSTVVVGNLKFNVSQEVPVGPRSPLFTQIKESGRTVIIAASTRKGEEEKLLKTIKSLVSTIPSVLFIIVPRHPERFDEVFGLFERDGFKCLRRSTATELGADTEIVIGDSMGELNSYYRVSQIAFVGGSLVDTGCQNVLEPAALSLPILTGPSQYNFSAICENLEKKGGLITVKDEMSLKAELTRLIKDKSLRSNMGAIALAEVNANQGALPKLLKIIEGLLD